MYCDTLATFKIDSIWGLLPARDGLSGPPWWNPDAVSELIRILTGLDPYVLAGDTGGV